MSTAKIEAARNEADAHGDQAMVDDAAERARLAIEEMMAAPLPAGDITRSSLQLQHRQRVKREYLAFSTPSATREWLPLERQVARWDWIARRAVLARDGLLPDSVETA